MITLQNFNSRQLSDTGGLQKIVKRCSNHLSNFFVPLSYFEVVNIEESALEVLIIDTKMIFFKMRLNLKKNSFSSFNDDFEGLFISLRLKEQENVLDAIEHCAEEKLPECQDRQALISSVKSSLSKVLEHLTFQNSAKLNLLEDVPSSQFQLDLKHFSKPEVYYAVRLIVQSQTQDIFKFKILDLTENCVDILAINKSFSFYKYSIYFSKEYSRFLNRYVSALLDPNDFIKFKKHLKTHQFTKSIQLTESNYKHSEKFDVASFLSFLLNKFQIEIKEEGLKDEGLKNATELFYATSTNSKEAHMKMIDFFQNARDYFDK